MLVHLPELQSADHELAKIHQFMSLFMLISIYDKYQISLLTHIFNFLFNIYNYISSEDVVHVSPLCLGEQYVIFFYLNSEAFVLFHTPSSRLLFLYLFPPSFFASLLFPPNLLQNWLGLTFEDWIAHNRHAFQVRILAVLTHPQRTRDRIELAAIPIKSGTLKSLYFVMDFCFVYTLGRRVREKSI